MYSIFNSWTMQLLRGLESLPCWDCSVKELHSRGGLTGSSPTQPVHWSSPQSMKESLPCTIWIKECILRVSCLFTKQWLKVPSLFGVLGMSTGRCPYWGCFCSGGAGSQVIYVLLYFGLWKQGCGKNGFHLLAIANLTLWDQSKGLDLVLSESLVSKFSNIHVVLNNGSGTNVSDRRSPLKVGASSSVNRWSVYKCLSLEQNLLQSNTVFSMLIQ